jgi:hypothetical protein
VSAEQPTPAGRRYAHAEAFSLMLYRSDDGTETEQVWNSRDGATPFVISLRSGKTATHVDWDRDQRMPEDWTPPPGMRYFTDLTEPRARQHAARAYDSWAADPRWAEDLRGTYGRNRDRAIAELTADYLRQPGTPDHNDPAEVTPRARSASATVTSLYPSRTTTRRSTSSSPSTS